MKVVIAIDSFKGSMSSMEAGNAAAAGIIRAIPDAEIIVKPLADGGEGTTQAFVEGMGGEWIEPKVFGPMGAQVIAPYAYIKNSKTAVIEMAAASGITLVKDAVRNPRRATTVGVGELIADAIKRGCRDFIVGIGGSATNDCGIGMLSALGFAFFDADRQLIDVREGDVIESLHKIKRIETDKTIPELSECRFKIACDVSNPLYGMNGATYIFGPQKGVSKDMLKDFNEAHMAFANTVRANSGKDVSGHPGAGAAGGLGFAFLSFMNAELISGVELVVKAIALEDSIKDADFVITGEGRLDGQTAMGKVPVGVAKLAKKYKAKVIALAGGVTDDAKACNDAGIDAYFSILPRVMNIEEAIRAENAVKNMTNAAEQLFRLIGEVFQ